MTDIESSYTFHTNMLAFISWENTRKGVNFNVDHFAAHNDTKRLIGSLIKHIKALEKAVNHPPLPPVFQNNLAFVEKVATLIQKVAKLEQHYSLSAILSTTIRPTSSTNI